MNKILEMAGEMTQLSGWYITMDIASNDKIGY